MNTILEDLYKIFQEYQSVTTDTRKITEGCIFFALKGDTFDGNTFAEKALALGASCAVIDNPLFKKDDNYILVEDVLTTLQDFARFYRRKFDFPVIAITGSNGKTTTKELVAAVMSSQYNTHYTKGNFNNHIGVPLTLLELNDDHEVAIIEMGANHKGEIELLCNIAEPTHGLVTNMGKAHLDGFGGFEGVKKGKSEMYRWLAAHKGTIFVNEDEPFLQDYIPEDARVIGYHRSVEPSLKTPQYEVTLEPSESFLKVGFLNSKGEMLHVLTNLVGEYNFANIATAVAVGKYFKVNTAKMKAALESYVPSMNRSQLVDYQGYTIIMDAYNANPTSMRNALLNLSKMPQSHKIAIIGDMRELGAESGVEHQDIFNLAQSLNFNQLITVGTEFGKVNTENTEGIHFNETGQAAEWFKAQNFDAETCILMKGSRGMRLETLLN
jgi:UDP-N-acetylmuramoyl-tripeptide--D-alanyl-D-alanine ligase